MEMTSSSPTILYADQEHDRLRTAVVFVIILGMHIGYQIMRGIFGLVGNTADYIYVLSCAGGLPIGSTTVISGSRSGARLPSFTKPAIRSSRSRQLWIARHRASLAS
jgi:hypothetical protein